MGGHFDIGASFWGIRPDMLERTGGARKPPPNCRGRAAASSQLSNSGC